MSEEKKRGLCESCHGEKWVRVLTYKGFSLGIPVIAPCPECVPEAYEKREEKREAV